MKTDELDFQLPPELIAQSPPLNRAASRLMHYQKQSESITHRQFSDLPNLLSPGDLLVFNDARVIPARFMLRKITGGAIEALFLAEPRINHWHVMLRNLGGVSPGTPLAFDADPRISVTIDQTLGHGEFILSVQTIEPALVLLERLGRMPLPPYIKRNKLRDPRDESDRVRYQTVYAKNPGAVAAPTAGLHFTPQLLDELKNKGVQTAMITLNVGPGTFKPVTADTLESHAMHSETYSIDSQAAEMLNLAEQNHQRIIAVGTTSARVLESHPAGEKWQPLNSETSIFIYPPYQWKHVGAMITNFHLPRSTLIALVAAMVGLPEQRIIYQQAIANRYRFFSYGDAMFIE